MRKSEVEAKSDGLARLSFNGVFFARVRHHLGRLARPSVVVADSHGRQLKLLW